MGFRVSGGGFWGLEGLGSLLGGLGFGVRVQQLWIEQFPVQLAVCDLEKTHPPKESHNIKKTTRLQILHTAVFQFLRCTKVYPKAQTLCPKP